MKRALFIITILVFGINFLYGQHYKKDGTPDMRYKENKTNYSSTPTYNSKSYSSPSYSSPSNSSEHLKSDGTPDMRYKENKQNYSTPTNSTPTFSLPTYSYPVERDANGKIKRSEKARYDFMKETGYKDGRPGYVIDHVIPLKKGGCDCPENMQWQTIEEAKDKDKWE